MKMWPQWLANHIYFSKPAFFVKGLILAHGLVDNAIVDQLILIVISTLKGKFKKYTVPVAAAFMNYEEFMAGIFLLLVTVLAEGYCGRFAAILYTTSTYIFGLLLLWLVVILDNITARLILLPSVVLTIAAGQAGKYPLGLFFMDQLTDKRETRSNVAEKKVNTCTKNWWVVLKILGSIVSAFLIAGKDPKVTFLALTLVMGAALLLLLCGICKYTYEKPTANPIRAAFTFLKVLVAAFVNCRLDYPDPSGYYQNHHNEQHFPPDLPCMRWIDKAAIDQKFRYWRCEVAEVKKVKRFITWFPLTPTLFVYSLVQGTGNAIFLTQTDGLNFCIANGFKFSIGAFLFIRSLTSAATSLLIDFLVAKKTSLVWRQRATLVRINAGMVVSTLFCLIAWRVEIHRSKLFELDQIDGPSRCFLSQYKLPMSIFWLTPQFIMLGLMDALVDVGHTVFFNNYVDPQLRRFEPPLSICAFRAQRYTSIVWAVVLFRHSLSTGHISTGGLAKCFKILAIVSFGSLFPHILVSYLYSSESVLQREDVRDDQGHPSRDVDLSFLHI